MRYACGRSAQNKPRTPALDPVTVANKPRRTLACQMGDLQVRLAIHSCHTRYNEKSTPRSFALSLFGRCLCWQNSIIVPTAADLRGIVRVAVILLKSIFFR